jgi:hypothetical protein
MALSYSPERTEQLLALISNQLQVASMRQRLEQEKDMKDDIHQFFEKQLLLMEQEIVKQRHDLNIAVNGL